jgi:multidrug resistance protein, MATE family
MLELSYKKILAIATPLMFGTLVQSIILVTDGIFVSELGTVAFDAVGNGGIMYMSLFMLCRGLGDGTQITIARKLGEGKNAEIGEVLFNAQFMQLILAVIIFTVFFIFGSLIITAISESDNIAVAMTDFMKYRSPGIFFAAMMVTMSAFFIGLGRTNIIIASTLILAGSNILLDYGLIFGKFGFPEMGMVGAPLASSIAEALAFFVLLLYALTSSAFKVYRFHLRQKIMKSHAFQLLKLSYPLMFQGVLTLSTWLVFFVLIEHMGEAELESSQTIRYCYFISFIPLFGFGATTKTYVSNLVGQKRLDLITKVQFKIGLMSLLFITIFFHGAIIYPELLVSLVNHNTNISPEVYSNSVVILRFVSGSMFLYSIVTVLFNSIAALGHTKISLLIEAITIFIYVICCYLFIVRWEWDVISIWWVEYIYFALLGLFSILYLIYYHKKIVPNEQ